MYRYMKRHYKIAIIAILLSILAQIITPVSVVLEQRILDYIIAGDMVNFIKILWLVATGVLMSVCTYYLKALAVNKLKSRCTEDLRNALLGSIIHRGQAKFYEKDTAEYISNIVNDVNTVTQNYTSPIFSVVSSGVSAVISLVIMIAYCPPLAAVAVVCSFASFWLPIIITRNLKKQLVNKSIQEAEMSVQLKEALNGRDVISSFGVFSAIQKKFEVANHALANVSYKLAKQVTLLENCAIVMGKVVRLIILYGAGIMATQGIISVGTVFLFVSLYEYFSSDVMLLSQCIPLLKGSKSVAGKLIAIIEEDDSYSAKHTFPSFSREVRVDQLSFQYVPDIPVLRDLSLTIHKGEKIALVGPSGCGKSTLVKLLGGNYENYRGGIYFDGVEMREVNTQQLRKLVSVIHQHTFIFNDSIRNNICLGEKFTESAMDRALDLSGVRLFLPSIDGGIDGNCGEDGVNLSGGQKQRIALARALIRNIDFLILDEGTSAIDVETANKIEQELLDMGELTLLTITHRIKDGLIHKYDSVFVMDKGQITERRF